MSETTTDQDESTARIEISAFDAADQQTRMIRIVGGALIAALLVVVAIMVERSMFTLTYFRLHLFLMAPIFGLALLPPAPLKYEPREMRVIGYTVPVIIAIMAVVFSTFWDNIIASRDVWTFDRDSMIFTIGHIPIEEYFWFIDHTVLGSLAVICMWSTKKERAPVPEDPRKGLRIVGAAICLGLTIAGVLMLMLADKTFFMGIILVFMFPVIGFMWWLGGHLMMQQLRELIIGIVLVSGYLLMVDSWAVRHDVWQFTNVYTTGITIFGVKIEQYMIYTITTLLVVPTVVFCMRQTEIIVQKRGSDPDKSIWSEMLSEVKQKLKLSV